MKKSILVSLLSILFLLNGCLTYHIVEYTIEYADDFNSGHISVRYTDIRSSEEEMEKQKKDFDELIQLYKDDIFLLDQVDEGVYIKDRQLYEKEGILIGSYSGIFQRLKIDDNEIKSRNNERYILMDTESDIKIETNGKIYQSENNALLVWPADKQKLKIKKVVKDYDNVGYPILEYYKNWKE